MNKTLKEVGSSRGLQAPIWHLWTVFCGAGTGPEEGSFGKVTRQEEAKEIKGQHCDGVSLSKRGDRLKAFLLRQDLRIT